MTPKRLKKLLFLFWPHRSVTCSRVFCLLFFFLYLPISSVRPAEGKGVANDATQSRRAPAASTAPPSAATAAASQVVACFVGGIAVERAADRVRGTTGQKRGRQCPAEFKRACSTAETADFWNGRISAEGGRKFNRTQNIRAVDAFESDRRKGPKEPKKVRINLFDQLFGRLIFG